MLHSFILIIKCYCKAHRPVPQTFILNGNLIPSQPNVHVSVDTGRARKGHEPGMKQRPFMP